MTVKHTPGEFSSPGLQATEKKTWEVFAPFIAPFVLASIAVTQLMFSYPRATLSTWKGGGFGMFSTMDSQDDRFLRIYLVTEHEEVPARLPTDEGARAEKLVVTGAESLAKALARTLIDARWVGSVEQCQPGASAKEHSSPADSSPAGRLAEGSAVASAHILKNGEKLKAGEWPITVEGLRVELWKIDFRKPEGAFGRQKLMEVRVSSDGSAL